MAVGGEIPVSLFAICNLKSPWLIVGLGNPGLEYADTYHNVGFRVVESIAREKQNPIRHWCGAALTSREFLLAGQPVVLVAPQTYMNRSGTIIPAFFEHFGVGARSLIVVYDDLALPIGRIRVRQKGSAGGHNGIKSLISTIGSDEFMRVRVGIQPDRETGNLHDYVLSDVANSDRDLLEKAEKIAAEAVETLVGNGIDQAMAAYNGLDLREKRDT